MVSFLVSFVNWVVSTQFTSSTRMLLYINGKSKMRKIEFLLSVSLSTDHHCQLLGLGKYMNYT